MTNKLEWNEQKDILLEGLEGRKREQVSILLDNQHKYLTEDAPAGATGQGNFAHFDNLMMPLVRRVTPALFAQELVGVQPLKLPMGMIRTLRFRYASTVTDGAAPPTNVVTSGTEASGQVVYDKYSLLAAGDAYNAVDAMTDIEQTAHLESAEVNEMTLDVVKKTVDTKSRKLRAVWTVEADQDAKALDGLDLENELVVGLSDQIGREMDSELLTNLRTLAPAANSYDFSTADGRYASEKFTALTIHIANLSNKIAVATKLGGATWVVVTPNVLVALRNSNNNVFQGPKDINLSQSAFVGTLWGTVKVYLDRYTTGDSILLGYKGDSELQTGYVYSPYIQLQRSEVVMNPTTMDPQLQIMTRYALTAFDDTADSLGNSSDYYQKSTITNLTFG